MRLRHVKGAQDIVDNNPEIVIKNPEENKGKWREFLGKDKNAKLSLEIGCGKGKFIHDLALSSPDELFIGIELMTSVICRAVTKLKEDEVANAILLNVNGENILDYFDEGEIDYLYINFCDPWPKDRHAKRRLTNERFLEKYKVVLKKDGIIRFKSDNYPLYQYSLETMPKYLKEGYEYGESVFTEGMIQTEFEEKFRAQGNPIYYIKGTFK